MKKYIAIAAAALACVSCDDFLDSENYTEANTGNYPASAGDLNKEIAALYGVMNQLSTDPLQTPWLVNAIMSDDCNGAGGTGDVECSAIGHLTTNKDGLYDNAWHSLYVGIARANAILATDQSIMASIPEKTCNQLLGEAYFMRGLFYMWTSQFWGDVPAYWAAAAPNPCPQVDAESVTWPHIIADFQSAYNLMSYDATVQGDGHATKVAAAGYLARAYMFYQGFYKKQGELAKANIPDMELPSQQAATATLSKKDVIDILDDAIASGKNDLLDEFQTLWTYTNEFTAPDYQYLKDAGVTGTWAGNGNKESVFQVQYCNSASWSGTIAMGFTNQTSLYVSLRTGSSKNGFSATFPFGEGWGQGVFNTNLYDEWDESDPRRDATIVDFRDSKNGSFDYVDDCSEETGLYNKKWAAVTTKATADNPHGGEDAYIFWDLVREKNEGGKISNANSMQGSHYEDMVLMRFADILLMQSELSGDATNMNRVRARVGLPVVGYTWANIKNERRFEFAGEGIRFNDLRRWSGKNGGESCEAAKALQKQDGTKVWYKGAETVMHHINSSWAKRYAETDGFIMIPPGQINVVANPAVLKQNPGWEGGNSRVSASPVY